MARRQDIDQILRNWPYEPGEVSARLVRGSDGREVLQMRVEMGILQLEVEGRPDGQHPGGCETYFDQLRRAGAARGRFVRAELASSAPRPTASSCSSITGGFAGWPCANFAGPSATPITPWPSWISCGPIRPTSNGCLSHEQYRPYVLFHRTQAAVLAKLEEIGAEAALAGVEPGAVPFPRPVRRIRRRGAVRRR